MKIALGLVFGICSLTAISPIMISCSNTTNNNEQINSVIFQPNEYSSQFISETIFSKMKNNAIKSSNLVSNYFTYYSKFISNGNNNEYLKNIYTKIKKVELIDSKLTIEFLLEFDVLNQNNRNSGYIHSIETKIYEINFEPNSSNNYAIKHTITNGSNIENEYVLNVNENQLKAVISFFSNNTSIFLVAITGDNLEINLNNRFENEIWQIISNLSVILAKSPKFYNDKTALGFNCYFSNTKLDLSFSTTNYETGKSKSVSYLFTKHTDGNWDLNYNVVEVIDDEELIPNECQQNKLISNEQIINFYKQIYDGNTILSFDEI